MDFDTDSLLGSFFSVINISMNGIIFLLLECIDII